MLLCFSQKSNSCSEISSERIFEILPTPYEDYSYNHFPKDIILSSAQNLVSLGEEEGITMNVRVQYSNERNSSVKKTPFKFVKNGKNIDGNHHHFIVTDITTISGILSKARYLFVVKRLRI